MEALQLGAGLDPDLLDQPGARVAVGLECLGLAAAPVEREHALAVKVLAQRLFGDQRVQLADHLAVATCLEIGVDRHLARAQAQLLEAADLIAGERLPGQVGQRLAAPQRERVARPALVEQPLREQRVDHAVGELELVAATVRDDDRAVAGERAAQVRDVELHHLPAARAAARPPTGLPRGDPPRPSGRAPGEHREDRPLLAGAQLDGPVLEANLERP